MKKIAYFFAMLAAVVMTACSSEALTESQNEGYITIEVTSVSTTVNKQSRTIPAGYDAKTLYVEVVDAAGNTLMSTDDAANWSGRLIALTAGRYKVNAHSAGWDGNDSGRGVPYYAASQDVVIAAGEKQDVALVCTQANVKVTVNFDQTMVNAFKSATVEVMSAVSGIASQTFTMAYDDTMTPAFFPVGNLTAKLTVINNKNEKYTMTSEITGVKARDHYTLNYTTTPTGNGAFTVTGDDSETQFSYTFSVPTTASTSLKVTNVNAWSNFTWVEGNIPSADVTIDPAKVRFEYKSTEDTGWTQVEAALDGDGETYKATLKNLAPATSYSVKMTYDDGEGNAFASSERAFMTEGAKELPNGDMEDWFLSGKSYYPGVQSEYSSNPFWDTSNPGSTTLGTSYNVTTGITSDFYSGAMCAQLKSKYVVMAFAAASMYAGSFQGTDGTTGIINFGRPWTDRPVQLRGWFKYSTGVIDKVKSGVNVDGVTVNVTRDKWSCYAALMTEGFQFRNKTVATIEETMPKWDTDSRVIAYGKVADEDCIETSEWTQFTVDLDYHDLTTKPSVIVIVISASKWGDYFAGSTSSTLLVDKLELVYGEPNN